MYEYVNNKQLISSMRSCCGDIMQDLCHILKVKYNIGATFTLVGSGARNLILQNANEPIDLDYNLKIINDSTFMFQSGYNIFQIYELKNNTFRPILRFIRENEKDVMTEWNTENNIWNDLTTEKENDVKANYLKLFEKSFEESFVGE